jgi:hypothetical protein
LLVVDDNDDNDDDDDDAAPSVEANEGVSLVDVMAVGI